jgi:hypothetical protein
LLKITREKEEEEEEEEEEKEEKRIQAVREHYRT